VRHAHWLVLLLFIPVTTFAEEPTKPWTLLVYGAVDNSADMPFIQFMDGLRKALDGDPGVEMVMLIDRSHNHPKKKTFLGDDFTTTRLYRIRKDSVERLAGGEHLPELKTDSDAKLNSADAATLGRFIAWGKTNFPAKRYGLLIYSHANGRSMCPVERNGVEMGVAEVTDKIPSASRVDFLALELCNMGGLEISYQWRPGNGGFEADVLLAIPNAGPPLDWDRAFKRIRSPGHAPAAGTAVDPATMTAADFGKLVIEEGHLGRKASERPGGRNSRETAGCYDLRQSGHVKQAVDALAVVLSKSNAKATVLELRGKSKTHDRTVYSYSGDGAYVDLIDLCRRLESCDRLSPDVRAAAKRVNDAVERFMLASFGMSAYPGFEPGRHGVFVVLPADTADAWKTYRWYTPLAGTGKDYGRWAFLRDAATPGNGTVENWFELLDTWFDTNDETGGLNKYKP
jgi:clostripain